MKAASAPASHSPIGYTQSAPASRYARARRRASGTRSPWAPARAREGRREEDIDPRVDHQPVALIGCRPADATQPYRLLGGIAQRRGGVVSVLEVAARCPHADENDPASARIRLHQRLGLRNIPDLIQAAVLDSALRAQVGGMRHFAAPSKTSAAGRSGRAPSLSWRTRKPGTPSPATIPAWSPYRIIVA
jgi:hypothetical protein